MKCCKRDHNDDGNCDVHRIEYEGTLSLELGKMAAPIRELEESLNSGLATFGMEGQRVKIVAPHHFTLKVSRILTQSEEEIVKKATENAAAEFNGKMTMFRRKSGHVSQSVSQSVS